MRITVFVLLFLAIGLPEATAQKSFYNTDKGVIAAGYDVVAYFGGKAQKGAANLSVMYDGIEFYFVSESHRKLFEATPEKYVPQYGGWCAYAMGTKGSKVEIDSETFEIRDGRLYLFYNAFFTNTFESWKEEGPVKLKVQADTNWGNQEHKK